MMFLSSEPLDLGGIPYIALHKCILIKHSLHSLGWEDHFRKSFTQASPPSEQYLLHVQSDGIRPDE